MIKLRAKIRCTSLMKAWQFLVTKVSLSWERNPLPSPSFYFLFGKKKNNMQKCIYSITAMYLLVPKSLSLHRNRTAQMTPPKTTNATTTPMMVGSPLWSGTKTEHQFLLVLWWYNIKYLCDRKKKSDKENYNGNTVQVAVWRK